MAAEVQQDSNIDSEVQRRFDQIIGRHMERLIGTRYGIGALPINSINVSCLILLIERENEIERLPSAAPERYTLETLCRELEETGFGPGQGMEVAVQEMIDKDYIQIEKEGLIPQKPAVSMTRLVDKTFPQMPGMNLVAYFIQTMDEVKSQRKDIESAAKQFDEVLNMQGVSPKKNPSLKTGPQIISKEGFKRQKILGRQNVKTISGDFGAASSEAKVLSADACKGKVKIRKLNFNRPLPVSDEPEEISPDENERIEVQETKRPTEEIETKTHSKGDLKEADNGLGKSAEPAASPPPETTLDADQEDRGNAEISESQTDGLAAEAYADEPRTSLEDESPETADEDIEKSIAAFEEDLSLQCPLCKRAKVQAENTARGRVYYKCLEKSCSFISWGKPYHIQCPRCNNPFLVESSDKSERLILKCPRATCRYWQRPPWEEADNPKAKFHSAGQENSNPNSLSHKPKRRVVKRKRRVRRKK